MLNKIVLLSCLGIFFFSGCASTQEEVKPVEVKKIVVVKKERNEISNMFNKKFHFKNKRVGDKPIYQIIYQNYKQGI